jgi:hypothetical protein
MGLEINTERKQREEKQAAMAMFTAPAKLWLTADREKVVEDGHPEAAFLFLREGEEIPADEAAKYGLKAADKPADKKGSKPADKTGNKPADKKGSKPADKTGSKPADKKGSKPADKTGSKPADKGTGDGADGE